jgi:FKBP-type peptidyl-prolyl cis-trans isomerase
MKKLNYVLLMIAPLALTISCGKMSYRKTKSGLVYKIFPSNGKEPLIKEGQVVKYNVVYKLNDDSVLYSSYDKMPAYDGVRKMDPPPYNLAELYTLMKKGDSAVTVQILDTLIKKGAQIPFPTKPGDRLVTHFRIVEVFASDSLARPDFNAAMEKDRPRQMKEQQEQQEKMEKEKKEQLAKEETELEKSGEITREIQAMQTYLAGKKISAQKTGKGTFVHIEKQGEGPAAQDGKYVNVKYTGKHLDTDSTFQSSTYSFQLGMGNAIPGWDEGLKLFKQGGKGTLYIPGFLCYGKNPPPGSPFKLLEPLKFDIELLQVSDTTIPRKPM